MVMTAENDLALILVEEDPRFATLRLLGAVPVTG